MIILIKCKNLNQNKPELSEIGLPGSILVIALDCFHGEDRGQQAQLKCEYISFLFSFKSKFFFVGKFTLPSLKTVKPSSDDLKLSAMSP